MRAAIVVAGGAGERFGRSGGKQLASIVGVPVLTRTLQVFDQCDAVDTVILVAHPTRVEEYRSRAVEAFGIRKVADVVAGGDTRQLSVAAGLARVPDQAEVIVVHDGARPLVDPALIYRAIEMLLLSAGVDGVVVGHPSYDTIKQVDPERRVTGTPDRATLWVAQTPQVFEAEALREASRKAATVGHLGTDDASLVSWNGGTVVMLEGPRDNLKVTAPEDVKLVEAIIAARGRDEDV